METSALRLKLPFCSSWAQTAFSTNIKSKSAVSDSTPLAVFPLWTMILGDCHPHLVFINNSTPTELNHPVELWKLRFKFALLYCPNGLWLGESCCPIHSDNWICLVVVGQAASTLSAHHSTKRVQSSKSVPSLMPKRTHIPRTTTMLGSNTSKSRLIASRTVVFGYFQDKT